MSFCNDEMKKVKMADGQPNGAQTRTVTFLTKRPGIEISCKFLVANHYITQAIRIKVVISSRQKITARTRVP